MSGALEQRGSREYHVEMIENLFETYSPGIVHRGFARTVDIEHGCCSARVEVELVDREGAELGYSNCRYGDCDFFLDDAGEFERVFPWFSGENVPV